VRERVVEQPGVGEDVAELPRKALRVLSHCVVGISTLSLNDTSMSTLPITGLRTV
jgi:hypothetical protein